MKHILTSSLAFLALAFASPVQAESANPCNPCSMQIPANPCNPCSMKKQSANPCDMNGHDKGETSMRDDGRMVDANGRTMIREHGFDNFQQAADAGRKMWNDATLGTSGVACLSCHADHERLNLDKNQSFPHYVAMVGDVVTLDQMINYCMLNPMRSKPFEASSKEMTAMAAYYRAYRMQYLREHKR